METSAQQSEINHVTFHSSIMEEHFENVVQMETMVYHGVLQKLTDTEGILREPGINAVQDVPV